jgi:hypothetical protein
MTGDVSLTLGSAKLSKPLTWNQKQNCATNRSVYCAPSCASLAIPIVQRISDHLSQHPSPPFQQRHSHVMSSVMSAFAFPLRQNALVVVGPGQLSLHQDAPLPDVAPDMALVRTVAVAINPVDAKMLDYSPAVGAIHGCDFAGVVVALGSEAPRHLSIGDRVAGAVHGNNSLEPRVGAFAQYVGATAELLLRIPDAMTFEEGSTLGIGLATAGLALFRELEVPVSLEDLIHRAGPDVEVEATPNAAWVLVSGGSTATGTRAIQLLKL